MGVAGPDYLYGYGRLMLTLHRVTIASASAVPSTVVSGGTAQLSASATDTAGHGIASWAWTDNGAGGTFYPSRYVQSPTWTAPGNSTGSPRAHRLTVTATCAGSPAASGSAGITVTENAATQSHFSDVPADFWAFAQIEACYTAGIVGGYWDGTYRPDEQVNRAQMAVYISRALAGGDSNVPPGPATATFPDVPTSYWAYKYVEYCHDQGVVGGYWDGYHPDETVNRAQMAVYVSRAMAGGDENVPPGPGSATFSDVPTSHWAYRYVEYCKAAGVVSGYWDGYHPEESVNRAQMAVYVQRAFALPM